MTTTTWEPDFAALLASVLSLDVQELTPQTSLHSAGLDSLSTIDLLLRLESVYGIELADDQLTESTFTTAAALWSVIEQARSADRTA